MRISILTPTYNRAKYLPKLYESIKQNIGDYSIEWLVMDDGSTDETQDVLKTFVSCDGLDVKCFKQENMGKMKSLNNLAEFVTGDLWIEIDSDDYFIPNVFEQIVKDFENLKDEDVYGLAYLKLNQNMENMGNNFQKEKTKMFDLYFKENEDGEKALVFLTKVRKQFRYELEDDEKFVTEARMYHKMDKRFWIVCKNIPVMVCEYQTEGYSKNINKQFIQNPVGYFKYFSEILEDMDTSNITFSKRLYVIKHYILFRYLVNEVGKEQKKEKKLKKNKKESKENKKIKNPIDKLLVCILTIPGVVKSKRFVKKMKE